MREHYEMLQKRGRKVPELEYDPLPEYLEYIWQWFLELDAAARPDGFNGPAANAIPPSEIEAWARCRLIELTPFDFELILMLDRIKRSIALKKVQHARKQNQSRRAGKRHK